MRESFVLWFTGLSGSGKTTIANGIRELLTREGRSVIVLDGDEMRKTIHRDLGFTPEDIIKNNDLIARLCLRHRKRYQYILVTTISPFAESRKKARELIGACFIEVYIKASLDAAIRRDVKGLYGKALKGEIKNFIGISPEVPYEEPSKPEIVIETDKLDIDASVKKLADYIQKTRTGDFRTLVFEKFTIFSFIFASLFFNPKAIKAYYFDISSSMKVFLNISKKIKPLKIEAVQIKFHLSEISEETGESSYNRIWTEDLVEICNEIKEEVLKQNRLITALISKCWEIANDKILMYFVRRVTLEVVKTIAFINVLKWYNEKETIFGERRQIEFLISNTPFAKIFKRYAHKNGITVLTGAIDLRAVFKKCCSAVFCILIQPLKDIMKYIVYSNRLQGHLKNNKPLVSIFCNSFKEATFDLKRKNDFFWLLQSDIHDSNVLVYFQDIYVSVNERAIKELKDRNIKFIVLSDKLHYSKEVPVWAPTSLYFRILLKLNILSFVAILREVVHLNFDFLFYADSIFLFNHTYAFWLDFFKSLNVKVDVNQHDSYPMNIPMHLAIENAGGISVSYQRSDYGVPVLLGNSCANVYFAFGPYYKEVMIKSGFLVNNLIYYGYITDYAFKEVVENSLRLRKILADKGVEYAISFFDENSSDDRMSIRKNSVLAGIYKRFFEEIIKDRNLGLICKSKKPGSLMKRIKEVSTLMDEAIGTGRCVFLEKGYYVSSVYPAEAAQASDITVGLLSGGTTVLESLLAGIPALYLDLEKLYSYEQYKIGRNVFVFDNLDGLFKKIEEFRRDTATVKQLEVLHEIVKVKDPFRDGMAGKRIGSYVCWLLESFDKGKNREEAVQEANKLYAQAWGEDKIIDMRKCYETAQHD